MYRGFLTASISSIVMLRAFPHFGIDRRLFHTPHTSRLVKTGTRSAMKMNGQGR